MLGLLIPRAREMVGGAELPALTVFMVGLGGWLMKWGLPLLAVIIAGVVWFRARLRRSPSFRQNWERRLFRLPFFAKGYGLLVNLRFCRTLAILIRGGVTVIEALGLAGRATGSRWIAVRSDEESENVRHGSRLSDAVARIPPLAESTPGWIRVGEAGGDLARLLEHAGTRYQNRWDRFVRRSLSFVEPAIILVIGGFVLLVTLSVLLPVIVLTRSIGG
jgi:general secretion pathway protein F